MLYVKKFKKLYRSDQIHRLEITSDIYYIFSLSVYKLVTDLIVNKV